MAPEWESVNIAPAVLRTNDEAKPVQVRVGVVRLDGGQQLAMQVENRLLLISPSSASKIIGALWRGMLPDR